MAARRAGSEKCQIRHFRLLTPKRVAHITRPSLMTAAPKRRQRLKQATEIAKQFAISGFRVSGFPKVEIGVLTDENVSNTTRHVDDADH